MKVGMMGVTFCSGNKGCEALGYSFLEALNQIGKRNGIKIEATLIEVFPTRFWLQNHCNMKKTVEKYMPSVTFSNVEFQCIFYKKIGNHIFFQPGLSKCECVFDFTYGDSFADIYGQERFVNGSGVKNAIIKKGIPFVLGSQTIGPFVNPELEKIAVDIIHASKEVYVRDELSYDYTKKISGREPLLTTDIAFLLPYEKVEVSNGERRKVGLNVSGLLWNGGYTRDNQFGLKVNYQEYCNRIIDTFIEKGYEVHLILHAYSQNLSSADNDLCAMIELRKKYGDKVIYSPEFKTPMEAKSYIAAMDVFIGARMHATIGAFSAEVPVIPFSYSRKFEGLFHSLNYKFIVHGCEDTTEEAVEKTIMWVDDLSLLQDGMQKGKMLIEEKTNYLIESYKKDIL